jgi:glyoxylase-like metal-dependent hydrolase (beta-lactamase superfamily II)
VVGIAVVVMGTASWHASTPHAERLEVSAEIVGVRAGDAYAYVLQRGTTIALVDAGSDRRGTALMQELARRGRHAGDVSAILLTDAHRDHLAAAALFPNAVTYVGRGDLDLAHGDAPPGGLVPKLLYRLSRPPVVRERLCTVLAGELLHVGPMEIEVIATPGHTQGSVMYRLGEVLFTGDSLLLRGSEVALSPWYLSRSTSENRRSLARLVRQPFTIIADSHNGVAFDGRARFERWMRREGVGLEPALDGEALRNP